ncbi:hypothetical protein H310_06352 [Aphanomyces invadans]|uniref:Uncharacterized protein n=1 Tax=Aphanomyces invadans TaxID=157072 RepID=A0A024U820_9STRA|nr:hypothetical protein H310_06352 [Aphanomyces invadans]ETW01748.1 hypothetical protein H310_06352 [Aphanomyces invadans]|eukprot:XP_008869596.1 hypothetical protein H310_06352 [Aphanomyces invadans]
MGIVVTAFTRKHFTYTTMAKIPSNTRTMARTAEMTALFAMVLPNTCCPMSIENDCSAAVRDVKFTSILGHEIDMSVMASAGEATVTSALWLSPLVEGGQSKVAQLVK